MTDIFLLRHGKSDWSEQVDDFNRPLTDRGKRSAQRIGCWLQTQGLAPDVIWSSPAKRAMETTEKAIKVMGKAVTEIVSVPELYEASLGSMLKVIEQAKQQNAKVLIVGHNPSMEQVIQHLLGVQLPETDDGKIMPTATLAHLSFSDEAVQLKQLIRPKTLPKQFPLPTPDGLCYADRPAYYYRQSGVIPYRWLQGELQIMLITKSSKTKWGIPKGIVEPGYSAVESAAKEAEEEAGIVGDIEPHSIGQYPHEKWGGICEITLYPMEVTQELDASQWESYKRTRQWFSVAEARQTVDNADVSDMIQSMAKRLRKG